MEFSKAGADSIQMGLRHTKSSMENVVGYPMSKKGVQKTIIQKYNIPTTQCFTSAWIEKFKNQDAS